MHKTVRGPLSKGDILWSLVYFFSNGLAPADKAANKVVVV